MASTAAVITLANHRIGLEIKELQTIQVELYYKVCSV